MGAHNFETIIYTRSDMKTAYQEAVEEALHEAGHDPYNGTISTTSGVTLSPLTTTAKPVPMNQIDHAALHSRLDHLNKWEHCEALPILAVTEARHEQVPGTVTVEATISSTAFTGSDPTIHDPGPLQKALTDAATREVRKRIRSEGALTTSDYFQRQETQHPAPGDAKDYLVTPFRHSIVQPPKVTTRATKGTTETRFFIIEKGSRTMPAWEHGYASQAEARAALPRTLPSAVRDGARSHDAGAGRQDCEVISMTRRAGGEGLVEHSLNALAGTTTKVLIRAHVSRLLEPAKVTDEPGWLFYGWAAC